MRKAAFAILILLLVAAGWWWITYLDEGATGPAIIGSAPPDVRVPVAEGVTEPVKLPTATPDATPETAGETAPIAVQPATGSDGTEVEIGQQAGDADAETASDAAGAAADAAADAAAIAADAAAEAVRASTDAGVAPASDAAAEAEMAARATGTQYDPELFYIAAMLHDLGLTETYMAKDRFEVDAADAAANAARNVVTDGDATGAGAAETAASAAQDAAAATEQAASAAVAAARIEAALTPAGFDADRVAQIIDQAQIPQIQKETLKNLVTSAGQDPALLREALDQVKAVMQ